MSPLRVVCDSCGHSWLLAANGSVYFQLDIVSHPCPYCEAYALRCEPEPIRGRTDHSIVSAHSPPPQTYPGDRAG